jgi:hypothetical protein
MTLEVPQVDNRHNRGYVFTTEQVILALHYLAGACACIIDQAPDIDLAERNRALLLVIDSKEEADIGPATYKRSDTIASGDICFIV